MDALGFVATISVVFIRLPHPLFFYPAQPLARCPDPVRFATLAPTRYSPACELDKDRKMERIKEIRKMRREWIGGKEKM
jgi:hypothetical protein